MTERDPDAIRRRCTRALSYSSLSRGMPRQVLAELLEATTRDRLLDAALDVAEATGVWMFARAAPTDSPLRQRVELACGDATLELGDDEIVGLFEALMARAH